MPFATIETDGFLFTRTASRFVIARAGFGDGYDAAQTLDDSTRSWSVKIDALPDLDVALVAGQTRAAYLFDFWLARKAAGNEPFWLLDPKDGLLYLADFADDALSFDLLCAKVYATGLELRQRRVTGTASPISPP